MSTSWLMCLCMAASLVMAKETADDSPFPQQQPSPLHQLQPPPHRSARISSTVKRQRLKNLKDQNHILEIKQEKRSSQNQRFQSILKRTIQPAKKSVALDLNMISNTKRFMEWTKIILNGISVLPKLGSPGRLIVFGENAEPILTGSTEDDVLIAAAEFGKGRILAIAGTSYDSVCSRENNYIESAVSTVGRNIKNWLTRFTFEKGNIIIYADETVNRVKVMSAKIVIYQGRGNIIPENELTDFVRNGGAFLHCFTPRSWLEQNKDRRLSDAPYMALLSGAGLFYTEDQINVPKSGFSVIDNKAKDAHALRFLIEARKNVDLARTREQTLETLRNLIKIGSLPLKAFVENLLNSCTIEIRNGSIPMPQNPVKGQFAKQLLQLWLFYFNLLEPIDIKAPGVILFPDDFRDNPSLKSRTLEFHSDREDYHSTGCYLPAGQTLAVEVLSGNNDSDWQLMVGSHTDVLVYDDWSRWPEISKRVQLINKRFELSSPFGGLIYFISPEKRNLHLKVKLDNVVDSPNFRLSPTEDKRGKEVWEKSRQSPGLWADIAGELITITVPAANVRKLEFEDLTSVMKSWDKVVRLHHELRGTSASEHRRQWIVTDEQPSFGWMHSGYPIVTHLYRDTSEWFFLNSKHLLKVGDWGVFHEMGHNMQRGEWTFDGTEEVTTNIFTLHAMDILCNVKPWIHPNIKDNLKETEMFFKDGADFRKWKNSGGIALFVYVQLAHEFGWESYKKVFRRYEAMNNFVKPKTNQEKMDTWFLIFSEVIQYNLAPLAHFWTIPLSVEAVARLRKAFPVGFLPDDEITRFAPERVKATLLKFPGTIRGTYKPAEFPAA